MIAVGLRERIGGVGLHLYHAAALLIVLKSAFGASELLIDLFDTLVDKLLRTSGHFILVFVSLRVVAQDELAQIIAGSLRTFVSERQVCDRRRTRVESSAETTLEVVCGLVRRLNDSFHLPI